MREEQKINSLEHLVGNTPLIEITYEYNNKQNKIYFKLEWYNLTGSVKDRIASYIIKSAYKTGELKERQPIIETSSGNTGISFSAIGKYLGHPVTILMPEHMSEERKLIIKSFGANLQLVKKEDGFLKCLELAKVLGKEQNAYLPLQFENKCNVGAHYEGTGLEVVKMLQKINKIPDALILGVGTGGTLEGMAKRFRKVNKNVKIFALEPASSPTLKVGKKIGTHKIQGISDDFIPPIINVKNLTGIVDIEDNDAIFMAQKLSRDLGLGVGISSGANFLGAVLIKDKLPKGSVVVSIFPDDNKKYLSIFLNEKLEIMPNYLFDKIKLLNYMVVA